MENTKYCSGCETTKELTEFGIDRSEKDGHRFQCKECRNAKQRDYARRNKELIRERNAKKREARQAYYQSEAGVESSRRAHLKRMYNISLEDYEQMSEQQNHRCMICGNEEMNNKNKVLCVDHCHETGAIRGLLCGLCNAGIGHFKDSPELLTNAIKYLEHYERT